MEWEAALPEKMYHDRISSYRTEKISVGYGGKKRIKKKCFFLFYESETVVRKPEGEKKIRNKNRRGSKKSHQLEQCL